MIRVLITDTFDIRVVNDGHSVQIQPKGIGPRDIMTLTSDEWRDLVLICNRIAVYEGY